MLNDFRSLTTVFMLPSQSLSVTCSTITIMTLPTAALWLLVQLPITFKGAEFNEPRNLNFQCNSNGLFRERNWEPLKLLIEPRVRTSFSDHSVICFCCGNSLRYGHLWKKLERCSNNWWNDALWVFLNPYGRQRDRSQDVNRPTHLISSIKLPESLVSGTISGGTFQFLYYSCVSMRLRNIN